MSSTTRPPIPKAMDFNIRYNAAFTCCVCRDSPIEQIHHIDKNPLNNVYDNLVGVCNECHGEAHTNHTMERNLTPYILKKVKKIWEREVKEHSAYSMSTSPEWGSSAIWTFFNFDKLPYLLESQKISFDKILFENLKAKNAINNHGVPVVHGFESCKMIYDLYDYDTSHELFDLYKSAMSDFLSKINPVEFCITRKKRELRAIVLEGKFIYFNRGVIFKKANERRMREAFFSYNKIRVEFMFDERFIWGSSCYADSFVGNKTVFGILFVKSIANKDGILVFSCSPIALGYGFNSKRKFSPFYNKLFDVNKNSSVYAYARRQDLEENENIEYPWEDTDDPFF